MTNQPDTAPGHDRSSPPAAELLGPLASWVGTWRGPGRGDFPTIEAFGYTEEVVFAPTGKPVLGYRQRTRADDGRPLHAESGWIRLVADAPTPAPDGAADGPVSVEWVIAQPTGLVEAALGTLDGGVLEVSATPLGTPTAVVVHDVRRRYQVADDELTYDLWMATEAVPETTHHLAARLRRVDD